MTNYLNVEGKNVAIRGAQGTLVKSGNGLKGPYGGNLSFSHIYLNKGKFSLQRLIVIKNAFHLN